MQKRSLKYERELKNYERELTMSKIYKRIYQAWKKGQMFTAVFLDVAGAFNNVHHGRLLHNLRTRRIPATIIRWVQSFLTDRTTRLQLNGAISHEIAVPAGIP